MFVLALRLLRERIKRTKAIHTTIQVVHLLSNMAIYYKPPLDLYYDFLEICKQGDLDKIRQFHEHVRTTTTPDEYPTFMGTVYNTLRGTDSEVANGPVLEWFQQIAAENHQLK